MRSLQIQIMKGKTWTHAELVDEGMYRSSCRLGGELVDTPTFVRGRLHLFVRVFHHAARELRNAQADPLGGST